VPQFYWFASRQPTPNRPQACPLVSRNGSRGGFAQRKAYSERRGCPGMDGAMTMSYQVDQPGILTKLKPGDRITAKVYDGNTATLYDVRLASPGSTTPTSAELLPPHARRIQGNQRPGYRRRRRCCLRLPYAFGLHIGNSRQMYSLRNGVGSYPSVRYSRLSTGFPYGARDSKAGENLKLFFRVLHPVPAKSSRSSRSCTRSSGTCS